MREGRAERSARSSGAVIFNDACRGVDPENPAGLEFVQGSNLLGDEWLAHCVDPRLFMPVAQCLGCGDLNLHHQKCSLKPPGFSGGQAGGGGFHRDSAYLLEAPGDALATILLQLDQTAAGVASTRVVPGSHLRTYDPSAIKPDLGIRDEAVADAFVHCPLSPGDALVIHPHVVHSVGANGSDRTSAALLICFKAAGAVDMQPGGNKRSLAEMPVARGWDACPLFPPGYLEALHRQLQLDEEEEKKEEKEAAAARL